MEARTQAGIELSGTVLRYAEVEQFGTHHRLLRLGSCDFEFDVEKHFLNNGQTHGLDAIAEALGDVFSGSRTDELRIALHPPTCTSFFSPVSHASTPASRTASVQWEASLLTGLVAGNSLRVTWESVRPADVDESTPPVDWIHVLGVREEVCDQIRRVLPAVPQTGYRFLLSTRAVAAVLGHLYASLPSRENDSAPFTLAIGQYGDYLEYTLCRKGSWYFSHYAEGGNASDAPYFVLNLLKHLKLSPRTIGRVYIYGDQANLNGFAALQSFFKLAPELLDPLRVLDLEPGGFADEFSVEAFAPCIGLVL